VNRQLAVPPSTLFRWVTSDPGESRDTPSSVIPLIANIFGNMRIEIGGQIDMLCKHAIFTPLGYQAVRKQGAVENKRFRWAQVKL
jgi:hypothetical protein